MKKIVSILSLVAVTTLLHAQGVVVFQSSNLGVLTNTGVSHFAGGSQVSGTSGKTGIAANGFMYQLFVQTYTGTLTPAATNIVGGLGFGWVAATSTGTPITGMAIDGLALPSGGTYDTAGHDYFMIAGWSQNLGTSWATVSSQLAAGFAGNTNNGAFFGVSIIGNTYAGGAQGLSPQSLFGANNAQTLQTVVPFTLWAVPVPEPSTMALAGLGSLALLLFRRRK